MAVSLVSTVAGTSAKERLKNWTQRATARLAVLLNRCFHSRSQQRVGLFVYHRVADQPAALPEPYWNVRPATFRSQLSGLMARGYEPISLRELIVPAATDSGRPRFVVTFDDGFRSVFTGAFPVLQELRVPATVFINTAYVDTDAPFPFDGWGQRHREQVPPDTWLPLSWPQCHEMAASGLVDFGSHTHSHADFRGSPAEFADDLAESRRQLVAQFGDQSFPFAFPFGRPHLGYAAPEMIEAVRKIGFSCALTTECVLVDKNTEPFGWGRFNAYETDNAASLAAKRDGWYGWAPRIQEQLYRCLQTLRGKR